LIDLVPDRSQPSPPVAAAPQPMVFQRDIYARVLDLLPKPPGRVLDVGAGQGYLCRLLCDRGVTVEGCDYSADDFRCPDVPFHAGDLMRGLPVPDASFDCAVSVEVIEHVPDHAKLVSELLRVVRPGGTVIITTPNLCDLASRRDFFLSGYNSAQPLPLDPAHPAPHLLHTNPIALPHLIYWIERAGGTVEQVATNRYRLGAWPLYLALYPLLWLALRRRLLRRRHAALRALHQRHLDFMLCRAALLGRIAIVVATKR